MTELELLECMLALFDEPGKWAKGALAYKDLEQTNSTEPTYPGAISWCLLGAGEKCLGRNDIDFVATSLGFVQVEEDYEDERFNEETRKWEPYMAKGEVYPYPDNVVEFNDDENTTYEDVVKLLQDRIVALKAEGQQLAMVLKTAIA